MHLSYRLLLKNQRILMRLKTDLVDVMMSATEPGGLATMELEWDRRTALGVVLAAHGLQPAAHGIGRLALRAAMGAAARLVAALEIGRRYLEAPLPATSS